MRRLYLLAVMLCSWLPGAAPCRADEDPGPPMLLPKDRMKLLMAPGEERTFTMGVLAGGAWTVSALPVRNSRARPLLAVHDAEDAEIDLESAAQSVKRVRDGVIVKNLPAAATRIWRLRVKNDGAAAGEVEIRVAAKLPAAPKLASPAADGTAHAVLGALPGSTLVASARFKGRVAASLTATPPSGAAQSAAGEGRAEFRGLLLGEFGDWSLDAAGPAGPVRGSVRIVPPRGRKDVDDGLVESLPDVTGSSPGATPNDVRVTFDLTGVGFREGQRLRLMRDGAFGRQGDVTPKPGGGASATIDLDDLPPGTYLATVANRALRAVDVPGTVVVSNAPARIDAVLPEYAWNERDVALRVAGGGFDPTSSLAATPNGAAAAVDLESEVRLNPRLWTATVRAEAFRTGSHDVTVTDAGGSATAVGALDFTGRKEADRRIGDDVRFRLPFSVAVDEQAGRLLVALTGEGGARFDLIDLQTGASISRRDVPGDIVRPTVRRRAADGSWALGWTVRVLDANGFLVSEEGRIAIAPAHAVDAASAPAAPIGDGFVDRVVAIPDDAGGGWAAVWTETLATGATSLHWAALGPGPSVRNDRSLLLHTASRPTFGFASAESLADGRAVVAYLEFDGLAGFVRRRVVGTDGREADEVRTAATGQWDDATYCATARDPGTDSVLVAFAWRDGPSVYPRVVLLSGPDAMPGPEEVFPAGAASTQGTLTSVGWHEERSEFVGVVTDFDCCTRVMRIRRDGKIRRADELEEWEGIFPHFFSRNGRGYILRLHDGTEDGFFDRTDSVAELRVFGMR